MKKLIAVVLALMMVLSVGAVAFAAETFVPSITYKDAPEIASAQLVYEDGKVEDVTAVCLMIMSVAQAQEDKGTMNPAAKELLLSVYEDLTKGKMELPADVLKAAGLEPTSAVIRELVDISWVCQENPNHADKLAQEGTQLVITFKMKGVKEGDKVSVMTYKNNAWGAIANVEVKDGEVTCTFDHLCPVAFVIGSDILPGTGAKLDAELVLWACMLVASAAALVVVVSKRRQNVA